MLMDIIYKWISHYRINTAYRVPLITAPSAENGTNAANVVQDIILEVIITEIYFLMILDLTPIYANHVLTPSVAFVLITIAHNAIMAITTIQF